MGSTNQTGFSSLLVLYEPKRFCIYPLLFLSLPSRFLFSGYDTFIYDFILICYLYLNGCGLEMLSYICEAPYNEFTDMTVGNMTALPTSIAMPRKITRFVLVPRDQMRGAAYRSQRKY